MLRKKKKRENAGNQPKVLTTGSEALAGDQIENENSMGATLQNAGVRGVAGLIDIEDSI